MIHEYPWIEMECLSQSSTTPEAGHRLALSEGQKENKAKKKEKKFESC